MEIMRKPRTVDGVRIQVRETVWSDSSRSFDVYKLDRNTLGACLTDDDSFDHDPTDDEVRTVLSLTSEGPA